MVHPTSVLNLVALFPFQILLPQATLNDTACLLGSSSVTMCLTEKRMDGHLDFHGLPLVLLAAFRAEQRCPNSVLCSLEFSCISIPTAISAMRSNEQIHNEWSQHNTTTRLIIVILQSLCLSCWDSPETRLLGLRATLDPIINCCDLSTHTHTQKMWQWMNVVRKLRDCELNILESNVATTIAKATTSFGQVDVPDLIFVAQFGEHGPHGKSILSSLLHRQLDTWKA